MSAGAGSAAFDADAARLDLALLLARDPMERLAETLEVDRATLLARFPGPDAVVLRYRGHAALVEVGPVPEATLMRLRDAALDLHACTTPPTEAYPSPAWQTEKRPPPSAPPARRPKT